ncbi:uncharacterized protein [Watersipora subatra]|uniref:uncharacterized protein n=1 Tax=Watersipora subatra TaxID=2589382 RepID=UPI00355C2038
MFSTAKDRLQVSSVFRASVVGIADPRQQLKMAGQPFHRMAPVPPHLTYKPEVSTYMDHFRKPQPTLRRRPVAPPELMGLRRSSPFKSGSAKGRSLPVPAVPKPKVKTTVKDYMDSMLQMTDKAFPPFNARVDVPFKTAQPNYRQRDDLKKISRSGYGISDTEARAIVRNDSSVNFYNQHKLAANNPITTTRLKSAPVTKMSQSKQIIPCTPHWMTWNSGTPEPPGLQKRLHRPWPTPEPPMIIDAERCFSRSSRCDSAVPRPATGTLHVTKPCSPVPDMIGSEGVNPHLTKDREQVFTPQPKSIAPVSLPSSGNAPHPLAYFM